MTCEADSTPNRCSLCGYMSHSDKMLDDQCRLMTAILGQRWGDRVGRSMTRRWVDKMVVINERAEERLMGFALRDYLEEAHVLNSKENDGDLTDDTQEFIDKDRESISNTEEDCNESEFVTLREVIEEQVPVVTAGKGVEHLNTSVSVSEDEFVTPFTSFEQKTEEQEQQRIDGNRKPWWLLKLLQKFQ